MSCLQDLLPVWFNLHFTLPLARRQLTLAVYVAVYGYLRQDEAIIPGGKLEIVRTKKMPTYKPYLQNVMLCIHYSLLLKPTIILIY
jgi:hypothetical protein